MDSDRAETYASPKIDGPEPGTDSEIRAPSMPNSESSAGNLPEINYFLQSKLFDQFPIAYSADEKSIIDRSGADQKSFGDSSHFGKNSYGSIGERLSIGKQKSADYSTIGYPKSFIYSNLGDLGPITYSSIAAPTPIIYPPLIRDQSISDSARNDGLAIGDQREKSIVTLQSKFDRGSIDYQPPPIAYSMGSHQISTSHPLSIFDLSPVTYSSNSAYSTAYQKSSVHQPISEYTAAICQSIAYQSTGGFESIDYSKLSDHPKSIFCPPSHGDSRAISNPKSIPCPPIAHTRPIIDPSRPKTTCHPHVIHWRPDPESLMPDFASKPYANLRESMPISSDQSLKSCSPSNSSDSTYIDPESPIAPISDYNSTSIIARPDHPPKSTITRPDQSISPKSDAGTCDRGSESINHNRMKKSISGDQTSDIDRPSKLMIAEEKPNISYVYMIQEAINTSPDRKLTLAEIYRQIESKYPYFTTLSPKKKLSWQNSIRHNLSLNECFIKLPKDGPRAATDRKGHYWIMDDNCQEQFEPGNCKRRRRMKRGISKPRPDDPWLMWSQQQLAQLQHLIAANSEQPPVDYFGATPPAVGQSHFPAPLGQLMPAHNAFCTTSVASSSSLYENSTTNGFLPSGTTLVNGAPMSFCYPPPAYNTGMGPF